jgi:hypothetical protein
MEIRTYLLVRRHMCKSTHVMQPVRQFHNDYTNLQNIIHSFVRKLVHTSILLMVELSI